MFDCSMNWLRVSFILSKMYSSTLQIIHVILENYEPDTSDDEVERGEAHHNWVDEVVRCEGRGGAVIASDPNYMIIRPRPEKRDPTLLTRLKPFSAR